MADFNSAQGVILFDLDGTLVDTAPDIVAAANLMLAELNAAALPFDLISSFIGKGVPNLVRCVMNVSDLAEKIEAAQSVNLFFKHYVQTNGRIGAVYPGVVEGLNRLKESGYRLACVTNKPYRLACDLLQAKGLMAYFELVVGGDSLAQMKPAAQPLWHACSTLGSAPDKALMVGDSPVDSAAARAAGMPVLIVNYGYPGSAGLAALDCDAFIDAFVEIPAFLILQRRALMPAPA